MKTDITIKLKIAELPKAFNVLKELCEANDQPFRGAAKSLAFDIQHEIHYISSKQLSEEDIRAIENQEVEFSPPLPCPSHYPIEYSDLLKKLCVHLPTRQARVAELLKKNPAKTAEK